MIPCKASSVKGKKHWIQALETKPQRRWSIVKSLQKSGGDSVIRKRGDMKGRLFLTVSSSFYFRTSPKNFSYQVPFPFQELKLHRFHVRWSEPHPTHYLPLSEHCQHLYRQNCIFCPKIPLPSISCQSTYMFLEDVQRVPPFFWSPVLPCLQMSIAVWKDWKWKHSFSGINICLVASGNVSFAPFEKLVNMCSHADGDVALCEMYVYFILFNGVRIECVCTST